MDCDAPASKRNKQNRVGSGIRIERGYGLFDKEKKLFGTCCKRCSAELCLRRGECV